MPPPSWCSTCMHTDAQPPFLLPQTHPCPVTDCVWSPQQAERLSGTCLNYWCSSFQNLLDYSCPCDYGEGTVLNALLAHVPLLLEEKHRWRFLIASTVFSPFSASDLCSFSGYHYQVYLKRGFRFSQHFLAWGDGWGYREPSTIAPSWCGLRTQDRVFSWRVSWILTLDVLPTVSSCVWWQVKGSLGVSHADTNLMRQLCGNQRWHKMTIFFLALKYLSPGLHAQTKPVATLTQSAKFPCKTQKFSD